MDRTTRLAGIAATLGAAVLWGTSFPANQIGLRTMAPGAFAGARFALAAILVLPFFWSKIWPVVHRWEPWALGAVNALAFYLQYVGQVTAPAGAAGLLVNANVFVVALVAWAWLDERPDRAVWLAMGLALVGASLIIYEPGVTGIQPGHLIVFISGSVFSIYMVGNRAALLEGFTPTALSLATFVTTGLLLSPFLILAPPPTGVVELGAIAYTAAACTVGAYLLYLTGLQRVGATASAVVLLVEVFVAALLGAWLLDEPFPPRKLLGGVAIAAAIAVLARPRKGR